MLIPTSKKTVDKVVTWIHDNKLTVNYTMLISLSNHSNKRFKLDVKIGDNILLLYHILPILVKKLAPKIGTFSCLRPRDLK